MRFLVLLALSAFACGLSAAIPGKSLPIVDMITQYGYPAETSTVTTQDGYILQLIRIRNGKQGDDDIAGSKPAVLLMHGFMSSAEDFVYGGPSNGLAFKLADYGYDIYLGNTRGSIYGQQHTTLNPNTDAAFWRFCWEDMGKKDLPAIIDKVVSISGDSQVTYIGHMEGATIFYVMSSEIPEYNEKIDNMMALGPITFMQHSTHPMLKKVVDNYKSKAWIIKNMGMNTFRPSSEVTSTAKSQCESIETKFPQVCQNIYFLFNGYNSEHLNQTTVNKALSRVPSGGSVREVLHYAQMLESGRFESYGFSDLGKIPTHDFDLSRVAVPVAVFYTADDPLAHVDDVKLLISKLPDVRQQGVVVGFTNNLEMLYGKWPTNLHNMVLEVLEQQKKQQKL